MSAKQQTPITIIGAGSWGTALALNLARRGQLVRIWSIELAEIEAMEKDKANNRYLPGHVLPDTIQPLPNLAEAVKDVEDILIVVPSVGFRTTLMKLKTLISHHTRIICATKGLDAETGHLLSEVVDQVLGQTHPFAMLSGPSFAREVAAGQPTAVVIASHHPAFLTDLIARFNSDIFHVEPSDDVIGVEIGGVVKNVIAIATGLSDGMGFGANARSAIITRGLAEVMRLGSALGGQHQTFLGLSGLGDLILTCSDNQSRNRRLGLAIGKGLSIAEAEKEIGQAIEGKRNAEIVAMLAEHKNIQMPICKAVWEILQGKVNAKHIVPQLLSA